MFVCGVGYLGIYVKAVGVCVDQRIALHKSSL